MATSSPFLRLPQELRDEIYTYALTPPPPSHQPFELDHRTRNPTRLSESNPRWPWDIHYPRTFPGSSAPWLPLLLTCRQINRETLSNLSHTNPSTASLTLSLDYPDIIPHALFLPTHPSNISALDMTVIIDHLYVSPHPLRHSTILTHGLTPAFCVGQQHPALLSHPPHNPILASVVAVLERWVQRGPHLGRKAPLTQKLRLARVGVTIAPPQPLDAMTLFYGCPTRQLAKLGEEFGGYVEKWARSGVADGSIERVEWGLEWSREMRGVDVKADGDEMGVW